MILCERLWKKGKKMRVWKKRNDCLQDCDGNSLKGNM